MPRMTLGGGYTDVPGIAEGLNDEQDAIKRRRLQLEALLSQEQTKGMTGLAGGLSNLALGLAKGYQNSQLDDQERDLAQRRAAAAQQWLERMPQDTPAQPEVNPSAPLAGAEGPPLPQTYRPPVEAEGGMVPQPPTYEHKDATPFLPAKLPDVAKWSLEGAGFSPLHGQIAAQTYKTALDAPIKEAERKAAFEDRQSLAREAAAAKREEDIRRHEDRLADNKREDARLEETKRSNLSTEEMRREAARSQVALRAESQRLQEQVTQGRADARSEKKSDQEKQVVRQTEKLGHQWNAEKIEPLDLLLGDVEKELEQYKDPKAPGGYKDIPGVGIIDIKKPDALLDAKELSMRRKIEPLRHLITVSSAGLSQTESEMKAVLQQDLGLGNWSSDASFALAIPTLRKVLEARKNSITSSFDPEAVETYQKRLKGGAAPPAGGGWGSVTKR